MRDRFKTPLGKLILDADTSQENVLGELGDGMLITVGDATTQKMMQYGIVPSIQIVDGTEKRARRDLPDRGLLRTRIRCSNPPGGITEEAITAIGEALASPKPSRILVDGEEDLLVLPVCTSAPLGSTVMYGQPNEGLVVVHVSAQVRDKAHSLLDMMDRI